MEVPITVSAFGLSVRLSLAKYMTTKMLWEDQTDKFLLTENFSLTASYMFYYEYNPSYLDVVKVFIKLHNPIVTFYPFMLMWYYCFLDNYLGKNKQYKTLAEYEKIKQVSFFLVLCKMYNFGKIFKVKTLEICRSCPTLAFFFVLNE